LRLELAPIVDVDAAMRIRGVGLLAGLGLALATSALSTSGQAKEKMTAEANGWCAPEFESLAGDHCYLNGGRTSSRRTLIVFLHGAIAKGTTWSWNHQRMLMKLAKAHEVEIVFPRSPSTDRGYLWPGKLEAQERQEQELIDGWMTAKRTLENRDARPFDEVFVMGFSSGAYFTSSLAMRGRLDVDGYAVFAGGQGMSRPTRAIEHFAPVFVGVCTEDDTTAAHSRAFAGALLAAGIPAMASEQNVGHGLSDVHFRQALGFLRRARRPHAS
jgi:predicted esterase